jgi:hypothetical protein
LFESNKEIFERSKKLICTQIFFVRAHYSNPKLKVNTFAHTPVCTAKFILQNVLLDFFFLDERSLFFNQHYFRNFNTFKEARFT